jgi:hypothetical protein
MAFGRAAPRPAPQPPAASDGRRETRTMVIKGGKICFGQTLVDCTVLDVSPHGARVRTDVVVPLPDTVVMRFNGGASYVARAQWARGTEIGFAFDRSMPMTGDDAASVALNALNALPKDDLAATMRALRTARFFDDPALAAAAEEAEAAYARFKAMLSERIRFPA